LAERAPQARIRPVLTTVSRHHPPSWTRWTLVRCVQNKCWTATVDRYGPRYHAQVTAPNTKSRWTWHYISAPRIILAPKSSTKTMTRSAGRRFNCSSRASLAAPRPRPAAGRPCAPLPECRDAPQAQGREADACHKDGGSQKLRAISFLLRVVATPLRQAHNIGSRSRCRDPRFSIGYGPIG
jgi:hypothetical protein